MNISDLHISQIGKVDKESFKLPSVEVTDCNLGDTIEDSRIVPEDLQASRDQSSRPKENFLAKQLNRLHTRNQSISEAQQLHFHPAQSRQ